MMNKNNNDLHQLQMRFQDYLTGQSEEFIEHIVSTKEALAEHRLGAYYNAYRIRLIDCLANDFPILKMSVGEEAFEYLILDYLKEYPSQHPSVRWVGQHMSKFLQHFEHEDQPFLIELAEFEWHQGLCFDGANTENLFRMQDMATINPEAWPELRFEFHPTLHWLDCHWNIPEYWSALNDQQDAPEKSYQDIPTRWLMWRKDMRANWRSLDVTEAWAIEAAVKGATFAEICEGLTEWLGDESVAITAAGFLKQWIHDEILVEVFLSPN